MRSARLLLLALPLSALVMSATLPACDRSTPVDAKGTPLGPPDQTYTTRGIITQLPGPQRMLSIHHESIPDFKNKFGETQPMKSHDMPFPNLAPGLAFSDFHVDDKVEFTFEVRWKSDQTWILTKVAKLPAETALQLK